MRFHQLELMPVSTCAHVTDIIQQIRFAKIVFKTTTITEEWNAAGTVMRTPAKMERVQKMEPVVVHQDSLEISVTAVAVM